MSDFDSVFQAAMGGSQKQQPKEESPFDAVFSQSFAGVSESPSIDLPKASEAPRSASYREGRQVGSPIVRGLVNAVNGPLMGFGDEVLGALGAVGKTLTNGQSFGDNYRETRDMYRGVQDQYKEDFPIGSTVTQLAASAPMIVANPLGKAFTSAATTVAPKTVAAMSNWMNPVNQVAGIIPRSVQAAGSGFGYGAVSGAGESTSEDVLGVAGDALKSGAVSAAMGGATPGVASVLGAGGRQITSRLSDTAAGNYAQQKVAEALNRDARGRLAEEGLTNPVNQALARFQTLGPEARLVDAGGKSTAGLLDITATLPGRTKNVLETAIRDRQAGRAGRLVESADAALGTAGREFGDTLATLDQIRKQSAAPYYAQIKQATAQVDDELMSLLGRSESTHRQAENLYLLETGRKIDLSKVKPGDEVPFSVLDTLKQSLYDAADSAKAARNGKLGAAFDGVRTTLIKKLDAISPRDEAGQSIYKLARDAYAGPSQLIGAAEIGRTAMKADSFAVKEAIRDMSQSEIEAFRVGALQALKEKAGTQSGQTSLLKMWMEPATSGRLKDIFGKDYREFAAAVAKEARLKPMEQLGRGSQTAARQFAAGDMDVSPLANAAQAAGAISSGSPVAVLPMLANAWNKVQTPEPVRDEIGRILLSRDPATLQRLSGLIPQINQSRARLANSAAGFQGVGMGGLLGGFSQ